MASETDQRVRFGLPSALIIPFGFKKKIRFHFWRDKSFKFR
jgi:hypothetical protein